MALGGLVLGSLILYLKGMRILMFQLSGFYYTILGVPYIKYSIMGPKPCSNYQGPYRTPTLKYTPEPEPHGRKAQNLEPRAEAQASTLKPFSPNPKLPKT